MTSSSSTPGTFVVDGKGRTLCHFSLDSHDTPSAPYKGQPMYYHFGDTAPGQAYGQGLFQFGEYWYVVPPK